MKYYYLTNAYIFGSLIGSFLNVVIYRMPLNLSVVTPRSKCPNCDFQLKWYHNLPVISYLFLRGKCSNCAKKISIQYPLVEFFIGAVAVLIFPQSINEFSMINYVLHFAIFCALFCHFIIDIKHKLLLDKINIFLMAIIVPVSLYKYGFQYVVLGGAVGFLFPLFVSWAFYKLRGVVGLGGGDVKLFGVMGLYLGLKGIIFNIFFSCFFGATITIALIVSKKIKRDQAIAFGPFIILTACLQMFLPDFFAQMVNALLF
jgi:leader peptidase (prepilin peptidase) / N-methyltransferase